MFELAGLKGLRRLSLIPKLMNITILFLIKHALLVEQLYLSYCDQLSLQVIQFLLRKLEHLEHLTVTGVLSCRRKGISGFQICHQRWAGIILLHCYVSELCTLDV